MPIILSHCSDVKTLLHEAEKFEGLSRSLSLEIHTFPGAMS